MFQINEFMFSMLLGILAYAYSYVTLVSSGL